jgi:hypothetical protein
MSALLFSMFRKTFFTNGNSKIATSRLPAEPTPCSGNVPARFFFVIFVSFVVKLTAESATMPL